MSRAADLLRQQIERIESLKHPPAYNPQYKIWENTTVIIIQENFNKEYVDMFLHQVGVMRMARSEYEQYQMFLERIEEQKQMLEGFIEESERFSSGNDVQLSTVSPLENYRFHKEVTGVSEKLFQDGHYDPAITEAFKKVVLEVKNYIKNVAGEDLDGDKAMNRAFGFESQEPLIKFNELQTIEDKDEQRGIMYLFKGVVGLRNKKSHQNTVLSDANKAIEHLALASLLLRLLDDHTS